MIESIRKEFIHNLGEIRNINLSNKKTYTFFYNELEEQIKEHLEPTVSNNKSKNILVDQKINISSINNKIRGLTYSIENLLLEYTKEPSINVNLDKFNNDLIHCIELIKNIESCTENFTQLCTGISPVLKSKEGENIILMPLESFFTQSIETIKEINTSITIFSEKIYKILNDIKTKLTQEIKTEKEKFDSSYQTRFKEDTALIIKRFENEISNLSKSYENQFKGLKLDNEKLVKSYSLLTKNVDIALKDLANLNERTQNIELEYSKIIVNETDKIKSELETSKVKISDEIDTIINHVKAKSQAIETVHSDFKTLVEKAGIYELTKNYEKKGNEEKTEYMKYRNYTSWSILAAIASTILVFIFAFIEHYFSKEGETTNYLLLASRLSISLMFFVLALYLSKQASKHYECYQENHRTFLQLAALEPFMARMTPEEQKEIRKGLIPSYFNQASDGKYSSKGDEVDFSTNATSIINNLIDKFGTKKESDSSNKPEGTAG
ncbi:hypothetical protein MMO39_10295 [Acinetobacter modestus]|uniref:hypothetical protein n=1 Tax=Acinetobacter modestus TaxID=1776740 RepID=UPI001F4AD461|nr:hypothetical protein [Acinetobacter modestus]MCH7387686.1 hypothetical protein [Acinetobacter modestus]